LILVKNKVPFAFKWKSVAEFFHYTLLTFYRQIEERINKCIQMLHNVVGSPICPAVYLAADVLSIGPVVENHQFLQG
jgi:hypothetical protein